MAPKTKTRDTKRTDARAFRLKHFSTLSKESRLLSSRVNLPVKRRSAALMMAFMNWVAREMLKAQNEIADSKRVSSAMASAAFDSVDFKIPHTDVIFGLRRGNKKPMLVHPLAHMLQGHVDDHTSNDEVA
jgi:hypothetical protein